MAADTWCKKHYVLSKATPNDGRGEHTSDIFLNVFWIS